MRICYAIPGALSRAPGGPGELERRRAFLEQCALGEATVEVRDDPDGPASIESAAEEARAAAAIAREVPRLAEQGADAVIIGCFGDPGLDAAREQVDIPVIGPAQASMHAAAQLGDRIGVLSVVGEALPMLRRLVRGYGLEPLLASLRAVNVPALDLRERRADVVERLAREGARALEDGADVIVLGCMSMGFMDVASGLRERLGIPVVNPVLAALHSAEVLVANGLAPSRRAFPRPRAASPA